MSAHGSLRTALALLLLATMALSVVFAGSHQHDSVDLAGGHGELPTFTAGHEHPVHTVHIESASSLEADSCVGCLQRQRQRADGRPAPAVAAIEPSSSALVQGSAARVSIDAGRLPASRAPPRA